MMEAGAIRAKTIAIAACLSRPCLPRPCFLPRPCLNLTQDLAPTLLKTLPQPWVGEVLNCPADKTHAFGTCQAICFSVCQMKFLVTVSCDLEGAAFPQHPLP